MAVEHLNLNDTIGAAFLGNVFAAILYGITCYQTCVYYQANSGRDSPVFKLVIGFLWLLDTLHMGLVTDVLHHYLVQNLNNTHVLVTPSWSLPAQVYVAVVCDFVVRLIYGLRVWSLTKRNIPLAIAIGLTSSVSTGASIAFATEGFRATLAERAMSPCLTNIAFAAAVAADAIIATTLCIFLSRSRTGFKRTDTILNTLMIYIISSGLLTTLFSALCLAVFVIWPTKFIFMAIYFCINKLYVISLLAMLNGRSALREQFSGVSSIPTNLLQPSPPSM